MAERKGKEPVFGKLDDLDAEASLPSRLRGSGLRSDPGEADHGDDALAWTERAGVADVGAGPAEPAISAASSLTMRSQPVDFEPEGPGHPGAAMRFARERLGLDTATLASQTRLPRRIIEDLEANRFDSMPPAYVRGYLRGVARELGVDPDGWIRAYEGMGYTEPVLRPTVQKNPSVRWGLSRGLWTLMVAAILLSALGLGVYAWTEGERQNPLAVVALWFGEVQQRFSPAGQEPAPAPQPGSDTAMPPASEPAVTELEWVHQAAPRDREQDPLQLGPMAEPEAPPRAESVSAAPSAEETSPATRSRIPRAVEEAVGPEPAVVLEPDASPESALPDPVPATPRPDPVMAREPSAGPEPEAASEATAEPTPAAGDGREPISIAQVRSTLTLSFDATSWVEVRSATDRVALQGIFHAGDERTISLSLPARVVLGNAPAVRVVRDGTTVDLAPHTRTDRTARFSLGSD